MGNQVRVDLLGASFNIETDKDPAYVGRIIGYLKTKTEEIASSTGTNDRLRIAILSAILVTDELFSERSKEDEVETDDTQLLEITEKIIDNIETILDE